MSTPTAAVARYEPVLSDVERMTLLGFLAGYRGFTPRRRALAGWMPLAAWFLVSVR
jgi:hypothetical protein